MLTCEQKKGSSFKITETEVLENPETSYYHTYEVTDQKKIKIKPKFSGGKVVPQERTHLRVKLPADRLSEVQELVTYFKSWEAQVIRTNKPLRSSGAQGFQGEDDRTCIRKYVEQEGSFVGNEDIVSLGIEIFETANKET